MVQRDAGYDLNGRIVLVGLEVTNKMYYPVYIMDLDDGTSHYLNTDPFWTVTVYISPDHRKIAVKFKVSNSIGSVLQLIDNQGEEIGYQRIIRGEIDSQSVTDLILTSLLGWYDNDNIVIDSVNFGDDIRIGPIIIYNPSSKKVTGTYQISGYPDADITYVSRPGWGEYSTSHAVYSPDYRYVVYAQLDGDITLQDIENNKSILTLDHAYLVSPQWDHDSRDFFTVRFTDEEKWKKGIYTCEFFRVDIDGKIQQLTRLMDVFPAADIRSFALSPDEKKIAFWLSTDPSKQDFNLAILDLDQGQVTLFEGIEFNPQRATARVREPVWLANNQQILVALEAEETYFRTVLVDLEEGWAMTIMENSYPIGWVVDEPSNDE